MDDEEGIGEAPIASVDGGVTLDDAAEKGALVFDGVVFDVHPAVRIAASIAITNMPAKNSLFMINAKSLL